MSGASYCMLTAIEASALFDQTLAIVSSSLSQLLTERNLAITATINWQSKIVPPIHLVGTYVIGRKDHSDCKEMGVTYQASGRSLMRAFLNWSSK